MSRAWVESMPALSTQVGPTCSTNGGCSWPPTMSGNGGVRLRRGERAVVGEGLVGERDHAGAAVPRARAGGLAQGGVVRGLDCTPPKGGRR